MNPLPKASPASAWGFLICCIGSIWTIITWFSTCSGINQMLGEEKAQGFSCLIPIWSNLYLANDIPNMLGEIVQREGLDVQVEKPNIVLCFLLPMIPMMQVFNSYNQVAEAYEAKQGGAVASA